MPRRWNHLDWDEPRPSHDEMTDSWSILTWEPVPLNLPAVDRYLDQVASTHINGGYLVGRWRAVDYTDATVWFLSRNRFEEYELFRLLLDDGSVREGLAELKIPAQLDAVPAGLRQQWPGVLSFDGILAGVIVHGGAYCKFAGSGRQAKELAGQAVDALTGGRFENVRLDASNSSWTPWFSGVIWDHTYVLSDTENAEITVLCITDSD